jgi:hypothetical protein
MILASAIESVEQNELTRQDRQARPLRSWKFLAHAVVNHKVHEDHKVFFVPFVALRGLRFAVAHSRLW